MCSKVFLVVDSSETSVDIYSHIRENRLECKLMNFQVVTILLQKGGSRTERVVILPEEEIFRK